MLAVIFACLAGSAASPGPPDLHVVIRSEFVYMAMTRSLSQEWWLSEGKSSATQGDRVTIVREDLGVTWRVSPKAGTYTEVKRAPNAAAPAGPPVTQAVDIHTAGYDWEAAYDWDVKPSGKTATLAGRPCREFVATGDADFAEADVSFWACDPALGATRSPTDLVANGLRGESTKRMILDTLAKNGGAWLLAAEERQEPAIAPTMVMRVRVETVEAAQAPAGTFDLPPGVKKTGK